LGRPQMKVSPRIGVHGRGAAGAAGAATAVAGAGAAAGGAASWAKAMAGAARMAADSSMAADFMGPPRARVLGPDQIVPASFAQSPKPCAIMLWNQIPAQESRRRRIAMDLEQHLVDAMRAELGRQCEEGELQLGAADDGVVEIKGRLDLEALAAVIAGAVAGGP
jgi:hypothetical protein